MEKEKAMANVIGREEFESLQNEVKEVEAEAQLVELTLISESYRANGREYYSYFVPLSIKGKAIKLEVRPKADDFNAYTFLIILFDDAYEKTKTREYKLTCQRMSMKGSDGKKTQYMQYTVDGNIDGLPVSVSVRPYGDSNKRMLEELYNQRVTF